eukprot:scaffold76122_cov54-Phaeocystis_antarctica.AAC.1
MCIRDRPCGGLRPCGGRAGPGVARHQAAAGGGPLLLLVLLLELRVAPVELAHHTLRREQPHPQLLLCLHTPPRTRARPRGRRRLQVLRGYLQGRARRGHRPGRRFEAPRVLGVGRGQPPQLVELTEGRLVLLPVERHARVGRLRPVGRTTTLTGGRGRGRGRGRGGVRHAAGESAPRASTEPGPASPVVAGALAGAPGTASGSARAAG